MLESMDHWQLRAALEWQVELGADAAFGEAPVNRYESPGAHSGPGQVPPAGPATPDPENAGPENAGPENAKFPAQAAASPSNPAPPEAPRAQAVAEHAAGTASDVAGLRAALETFENCELKRGARNLVFADGNVTARLMVVGEVPDRDEDRQGLPFVGAQGVLFDKMLGAIGMARDAVDAETSVYLTTILPWRPPHNRDPNPEEIAMMCPFIKRHIELVKPEILIFMGATVCDALLGQRGISRLRGTWAEYAGIPVMPMVHPTHLLRAPEGKRAAWQDLLEIQARLRPQAGAQT